MESLDTYRKVFTKDDINALPLRRYNGVIRVVNTCAGLRKALKDVGREPVLGFDTETRPTFGKGKAENLPALLQLATSKAIYLFQLKCLSLPEELCTILSDPSQIKAGVGVHDDIRILRRVSTFEPSGFVDLAEVARENGFKTFGLRSLAANLLGFRISKNAQCSNWELKKLSQKQIVYAATDAWVSRELHLRIQSLGLLSSLH
jgi:ribonuclease D